MANPILSTLAAARRSMRRHQGVPSETRMPMWRLLAGEARHGLRLLGAPERLLPAVFAALLIGVGLSPATPGPVAAPALRLFLAVLAALGGAWVGSRLLLPPTTTQQRRRPGGWAGAASGVGSVLLAVATLALAGWLLAMLIAALY